VTPGGSAGQETVQEAPPPEPGPLARLLQELLPDVGFTIKETPLDETVTISRDDFSTVMATLKSHERLRFDYLRCLSGVDYLTEFETVYHFYSFEHGHKLAVKVRCPYEDPHVPTVSHLWATANWHERETHEMYGIVFDGHTDLRPLLTEEGLGYFPLRKSHPLADIEEWQEGYLAAIDEAKRQAASAGGEAPPPMSKVEIAQVKGKLMKEARDKARADGLSTEDEKAAVRAAIDKFNADLESGQVGGGAAAAPPPMSKVELAQAKSKIITKARNEARANGLSTEDEKKFVAEALKKFSAEQAAGAAPAAAAPKKEMSKVELAQAKAKVITKARNEARAKGMSTEDEKKFVSEALKKFSAEQAG
jgi:NADH-quinone oxidoreductase subunit C